MASKPEASSDSSPTVDDSWIVVDDLPENGGEVDESVLNPMSSRTRSVNNLIQRMRRLKVKRSSSSVEQGPMRQPEGQCDNRGGLISVFRRLRSKSSTDGGERQRTQEERFTHRQNSTPETQSSTVTSHCTITHTPSMPVMVGRGLTDSLPTPGHRAPQDATAGVYAASLTTAATAKVYDELKAKDRELAALQLKAKDHELAALQLKAKDRELAALQLKLEMKDQEGHKHKLNVEKLKRQIEKLTDQRVQQNINSGQMMEEVIQEGEKRVSQMKQHLQEEQIKSKQKKEEIDELERQIEKVSNERVQQSISSGQKMKKVQQEGEKKVSQMKQQLIKEQTKSKQKEEEIDKLKTKLEELQVHLVQQDDMIESQEELLRSFQASQQYLSQSVDTTPVTVDLKSTTIDFADKLSGRLIAQHPVISGLVDDLAKSHGVTVSVTLTEDTASLMQATLTGSQGGIDQLAEEISSLSNQLQFDLDTQVKELSCMFAPLFLSDSVASALAEIEESHLIEISVIEHNGAYLSIEEFSSYFGPKVAGRPLCVSDLKQFRRPNVPICMDFNWKVKDRNGQIVPFGKQTQQHLTDFYNSSKDSKTTLKLNGEQFVADVNSLELIKVKTGDSFTLIKEDQRPVWSYSEDNKKFVEHAAADSVAIEDLYRCGGSFVTLAGNKHTLDLNKMQQINLETGESIAVRRHPAMVQGVVPEFSITIAVRGLGDSLDAAIKAVQQKLESFICSCTLISEFMATVPPEWQEIILIQVYNAARQYCLKIGSFDVQNGKLTMQLQGSKYVIDKIHVVLKEHCLELQHHIISHVLEHTLQLVSAISSCYPPEWEPQQNDIELVDVQKGSAEWANVETLMKQTIPNVAIVYLDRIQNMRMWDKYALEKKHMSERNGGDANVNEMRLFHGTRDTDPLTIIQAVRGIDFRYSRRDYQLLWGTGAYFAVNASYSNNYCYVDQEHRVKQLLLVKVLTGKSCSYGKKNDPDLTKPPALSQGNPLLYDTVNGFTNGSYVYIVYDHDRAYPAYLISYLS